MSGGTFISICNKCGQRRYSHTTRILSRCGLLRRGKERCNGIYELLIQYTYSDGQTQIRDWA